MREALPLLLLPGMMCDQRLWAAQLDEFSPYRSVQVAEIHGADSIDAIATQVLAVAPARFVMAGLSMGGIVAFEMWRQAAGRIAGLVLLDTNYRADPVERRAIRLKQMERVRAGRLREVLREELKPNYLAEQNKRDEALLDEVLAMGMGLGEDVFCSQSVALMERGDSSATLADIACPTLVLCGEEDTLCPVTIHQQMAEQIPAATLSVLPDCGHLSTMEAPQQVNEAMRRWLAEHAL